MSAAMHAADPATVRRLIEVGEPIDASDVGLLRTPLLWAAEHGHTDLVRFLLERGADIEDRADERESPLMLAAVGGHRDTVQVLLERGADPDYVTDKGWDAVMFAELGKHDGVAALIKEAQGHHGPLHEDERTSDI
jgi:ankyrin repeat protein